MLALLKKDVLRRLQPGATPFLYRMPAKPQPVSGILPPESIPPDMLGKCKR
jgi:hypothetical protein